MKISVIVPVLNEEKTLSRLLSALYFSDGDELIVVDGGSSDATVDTAYGFTENVLVTRRGRGRQMNCGAKAAKGDIFLFLHADCMLPENGFRIIRDIMRDESVAVGAFDLGIDHPSFCFRVIEFGANLRSKVTSIPYGDQGVFMRKEVFERTEGFTEIPLMEDIEMAKRLKRVGKVVFVGPPVRTSPRRWLKEGPVYTTLRDWCLAVSYSFFDVSPGTLAKYYRDVR